MKNNVVKLRLGGPNEGESETKHIISARADTKKSPRNVGQSSTRPPSVDVVLQDLNCSIVALVSCRGRCYKALQR